MENKVKDCKNEKKQRTRNRTEGKKIKINPLINFTLLGLKFSLTPPVSYTVAKESDELYRKPDHRLMNVHLRQINFKILYSIVFFYICTEWGYLQPGRRLYTKNRNSYDEVYF